MQKKVATLSIQIELNKKQLDLEEEVFLHEIHDIGNFPISIARSGSGSIEGTLN